MTKPNELPKDVVRKLLAIRNALLIKDLDEAYHVLYSIADPEFESTKPWELLEEASK